MFDDKMQLREDYDDLPGRRPERRGYSLFLAPILMLLGPLTLPILLLTWFAIMLK